MLKGATIVFDLDGTLVDTAPDHPEYGRIELRDRDGVAIRYYRWHQGDPDACCQLRKVEPLEQALAPFDGWISGRKRIHGGQRVTLNLAEADGDRLKLNPLAHWSVREIAAYMDAHELPRHPLARKGYASIGCEPCTGQTRVGEAPRAGRWPGQDKDECGIHFIGGRAVRG